MSSFGSQESRHEKLIGTKHDYKTHGVSALHYHSSGLPNTLQTVGEISTLPRGQEVRVSHVAGLDAIQSTTRRGSY